MPTLQTLLYLLLILPSIICPITTEDEGRELTQKELEIESRSCTKNVGFGKNKCTDTTNCCYYEYFDTRVQELLPVCTSINTFRRFYVRNENVYLANLGLSNYYSRVKANNFCDIINSDSNFVQVNECACWATQLGRGMLSAAIFILGMVVALLK